MHLSPGAKHDAIKLLNAARAEVVLGDILETGSKTLQVAENTVEAPGIEGLKWCRRKPSRDVYLTNNGSTSLRFFVPSGSTPIPRNSSLAARSRPCGVHGAESRSAAMTLLRAPSTAAHDCPQLAPLPVRRVEANRAPSWGAPSVLRSATRSISPRRSSLPA